MTGTIDHRVSATDSDNTPSTTKETQPIGPPPPFDPEVAAELRWRGDAVVTSLHSEQIPELRRRAAAEPAPTNHQLRLGGNFAVTEHTIASSDGRSSIDLLCCLPSAQLRPTPVIYWIHGGGMVVGSHRDELFPVLVLARSIAAAVVSVDYRLAPEAPHPGPVNDCYDGLRWTFDNAAMLNADPSKVIVAGISAGGGLAAATTLMARDRAEVEVAAQMLLCPMLDDRNDSYSARQMAGLGAWDRTANEVGWRALLGSTADGQHVPAYAAPARATDFSGLPPTFIDVGSAETFRDEDIHYANEIWRAGGQAELHVWAGGAHGFESLAPAARITRDAREARMRWLRRQFRGHAGFVNVVPGEPE